MSKKAKLVPEEKEFLILRYRKLNLSLLEFYRIYSVKITIIHRWRIKYNTEGSEGLKEIKMKTEDLRR